MDKKEVAVIRVVTMEDPELVNMHGRLIEAYYPALHTTSYCIQDQPTGICSPETKMLAVPKILELARAHQDADAIVISCCDDPAVREIRRELQVPVIGAGSSVCALAQSYGQKVGIIGITDYEPYVELLKDRMINLGRPDNVNSTLDLMTETGRKGVIKLAYALKEHGADSIALACTGMSTIQIAKVIEDVCKIPVIDPVMAEGLFTYYACLRQSNW